LRVQSPQSLWIAACFTVNGRWVRDAAESLLRIIGLSKLAKKFLLSVKSRCYATAVVSHLYENYALMHNY
jgi:hypothetical protein